MRGRTPEQQASRQRFHILQDGGAGGGEAGDALEPGVGDGERAAPEHIGQHPEQEGQEPGQEDDHIPVPERDVARLPHEDEGEDAHREGQCKTDQERSQGAVTAVVERDAHGEQHEQRAHQERRSRVPRYDAQVHSVSSERDSFNCLIRRLYCRFSSVMSEMPSLSRDSSSSPSKVTL